MIRNYILRKLRLLLFPFALIYGLVMAVRNLFFSWGIFKSSSFDIPIISIGNITVGGTGKTPHTEYIINLLKDHHRLAVLSRGYGRNTKGYLEVSEQSIPGRCGDEPCQMKQKFPTQTVVVDENRCEGVNKLLQGDKADVILLDDAYQHRWVKPGLSILLVDYSRPLYKDFILPMGDLREFPVGSKRSDIIIITKCPEHISDIEKAEFSKRLRLKVHQIIAFSSFAYGNLQMVFPECSMRNPDLKNADILLLTGIANPKPLQQHLTDRGAQIHMLSFADHHNFSDKDLNSIEEQFAAIESKNKFIITTEKDAVRLRTNINFSMIIKEHMLYLPIEVQILDNETIFHQKIKDYVAKN